MSTMNSYIVLLRGINVGGKNKMPMADLKTCLQQLGFESVLTYIASGNAIFKSNKTSEEIKACIEDILPKSFDLDSEFVRVLVLTYDQLKSVIDNKSEGFGEQPDIYHSDVIFLMGLQSEEVMSVFNPREGVDKVWPGGGVIYSQRLSSQRTKSRLNKIMTVPEYKLMTIRNWNTATKLLELTEKMKI